MAPASYKRLMAGLSLLAIVGTALSIVACCGRCTVRPTTNPANYSPLSSAYSLYVKSGESKPGARRAAAFENIALKLNLFIQNPALTKEAAMRYLGAPDSLMANQWGYLYYREATHSEWMVVIFWDAHGTATQMYWAEVPATTAP